jgi:hypothetical protein
MHGIRFDDLTRRMSLRLSRRRVTPLLAGILCGSGAARGTSGLPALAQTCIGLRKPCAGTDLPCCNDNATCGSGGTCCLTTLSKCRKGKQCCTGLCKRILFTSGQRCCRPAGEPSLNAGNGEPTGCCSRAIGLRRPECPGPGSVVCCLATGKSCASNCECCFGHDCIGGKCQ